MAVCCHELRDYREHFPLKDRAGIKRWIKQCKSDSLGKCTPVGMSGCKQAAHPKYIQGTSTNAKNFGGTVETCTELFYGDFKT